MAMLKAVWAAIVAFFGPKGAGGYLLKELAKHAASEAVQMLKDDDIGRKAIMYVKELHNRTDIDNFQKAAEFNKRLGAYCLKLGKHVGESTLNLLRELAVATFKAERAAAQITEQK